MVGWYSVFFSKLNTAYVMLISAWSAGVCSSNRPMRIYNLPGKEKQAAELFAEFPRTLRFWEDLIGPYPWSDQKMGVIRVPFSGLENQTLKDRKSTRLNSSH